MKPVLPQQYRWLSEEKSPAILKEALHCYGVLEFKGDANNPVIIEWAKEVGGWIGSWYTQDSVPWCGLFIAVCAKRAGFPFNQKALSAREWANWGNPVAAPMLGDVLVFERPGGAHVALYVAEDGDAYHCLGGNQSDSVNITRIKKDRLLEARRCAWKISQPANVRRVFINDNGDLSENEQ
jgi:uncharacterized protein (TIGR02594 family)